METRKIEDLLRDLSERGIERARPELGQEIKARIPNRLVVRPLDTINIIVDLRISRIAAAAIILLATFIIGGLLAGRDGKLMLRYTLGGENACRAEFAGNLTQLRDALAAQGREVVFCSDRVNLKDPCTVLMYWKLSGDKYSVILGDMTARTVSAETLIRLQGNMLQGRPK